MVVTHTDSWRQTSDHKWTTVYPYVGTLSGLVLADVDAFLSLDAALCYNGTTGGGFISHGAFYDLTAKGSPLFQESVVLPYSGSDWVTAAGAVGQELNREVAAVLEWPGGLSRTGKPITFKKWIHAVPLSPSTAGGSDDIDGATATALKATMASIVTHFAGQGLAMGNARRFAGTGYIVRSVYENHQMPKGRKRPKA